MSFLKSLFGKKEAEPVTLSYADFWDWFSKNEKEFFKTVSGRENIEKDFFAKIGPKLGEIQSGFYFVTGMSDAQTVELILTPDGVIKNIFAIEELVSAAPKLDGWKFTALKPATNSKDFGIEMEGLKFNFENLSFFPVTSADFPDKIDLTIVYDYFTEENRRVITNAIYIFLDNFLGELDSVTIIDYLTVTGKETIREELIPIEKLKDYLIWREKEFVEKYEGLRHSTENDNYAALEATLQDGSPLIAIINTDVLGWDKKASHPWILTVDIPFNGGNNGMPDSATYELLNQIEDELIAELKDADGYLNIGRQTAESKREIYFACKEFRKPPKVLNKIIDKYNAAIQISYDIYKDKYWQSFSHFEPR